MLKGQKKHIDDPNEGELMSILIQNFRLTMSAKKVSIPLLHYYFTTSKIESPLFEFED